VLADPFRILPDLTTGNGTHLPFNAWAAHPSGVPKLPHRPDVYRVVPIRYSTS
jgi:hypothetical protein